MTRYSRRLKRVAVVVFHLALGASLPMSTLGTSSCSLDNLVWWQMRILVALTILDALIREDP